MLVSTSDVEQQDDFAAGFEGTKPAVRTPAESSGEPATVTDSGPPAAEKPSDVQTPEPETPAAAPNYIQITKEQFDGLQSAASKTTSLEEQLTKAVASVDGVQQIVTKLQSETPKGLAVDLPADLLADMEKDFPELAGHVRKALERALKEGLKGTASPEKDWDKLIEVAVNKREIEKLDDAHPTWREIVGAQNDPSNAYRQWLTKRDAAYQAKINSSNSAWVIRRSIDRFHKETAKPATAEAKPSAKVIERKEIIKAALQPKGDGRAPPPSKSSDDEFNEGFRTG